MAFTVISDSFKDGDYLRSDFILSADFGFGCTGGNKSPHLKWSGAPDGTKSFAITCYDPNAPTGSGFWHWLVVNIPATVNELAEGAGSTSGKLPAGASPFEFSSIFVSFANQRSRFRPLNLWRACGGYFKRERLRQSAPAPPRSAEVTPEISFIVHPPSCHTRHRLQP
jgi:Raf kinase inhibitor-like YbhB/YbcL family protein